MRGFTKVATALVAVGLVASVAACSSSGGDKKPVGSFATLTKGTTTVVPAAGFTTALKTLGLKLGLEGTAQMTSQGVAFPITGGKATIYKKGEVTPYVQGVIDHNGSGLTLTAGSTVVTLKNFVINPGNNSNLTGDVDVNGKSAASGALLFNLDGSTLKTPTISGGYATLQGTTIYLAPSAAKTLDSVFKTSALEKAGKVEVGTAIIHVTGTS